MNISSLSKEFNFRDLDINRAGSWPTGVKTVGFLMIFIVIVCVGYFLHLKDKNIILTNKEKKSEQLRAEYESKAFKVANLAAYREQMTHIEAMFSILLRQLPSDTEVPSLLEDITHTGLGSGLEFTSITLKPEFQSDFYIELPIELVVKGGYHEMGSFISGVASMPRIVTLHDFIIIPDEDSSDLKMTVLAKTYRYEAQEDI